MTQVLLSQATQNLINIARNSGPGSNNQNYYNAYMAIYGDIVSHGGFDSGTAYWFSQAGLVNRHDPSSDAAAYIWAYTKAAAAAQGVTLSDNDLQIASNAIGFDVFDRLAQNGFVFSDNLADPINFAPKSIIQSEAGIGLTELRDLHPEENLSNSTWGGTLFARTLLNDPTYLTDQNIDLTPGSTDCYAILWGAAKGLGPVFS